MAVKIFDLEQYAKTARQAVAEGAVLLKNDGGVLPLHEGDSIAVFGRSQFHYYKSGTGSGGLVNTSYAIGILEALEQSKAYKLNETVKNIYLKWLEENPFDEGVGWAAEPWSQKEMIVSDELVSQARKESEAAIIILGRTAGEDKDAAAEPGSYLLTEIEEHMLHQVCSAFEKTIVLLNVGNIIDMKWVEKYNPAAVLYVWQGGQEGGNGVLDVLNGTVSPCGKLTDTIAKDIEDYPSTPYFGDAERNFYVEDIYAGYRYFETFRKDRVLYPFGYGLSYTTFQSKLMNWSAAGDFISVELSVANTGNCPGKEVIQLYCKAPQGELGKPFRSLCSFKKTRTLQPGEMETITMTVSKAELASYDDSGAAGHKSCFVLEKGEYQFFFGSDVRSAGYAGCYVQQETKVVKQLSEALAPEVNFNRMKPRATDQTGAMAEISYEPVPLRVIPVGDKVKAGRQSGIPYTGDKGWKLKDVAEGKVSLTEFVAQLSEEDLICLARGEGMSSPKATPGTAGAFGGVTEELKGFGIPVGCCADGPSGIRMDCGTIAFSLPNGTCLACSFNVELSRELFEFVGLELRKNRVDTLLGPGMNLHRNPLNGRNFEYFSEDPLVTGKMAAAQLQGMGKYGVTGTIKHFACNNQEFKRSDAEMVVSERALREIYLKGFEIAVKEGQAYSIMSTYGPINGFWTASSHDLLTHILRGEWGYEGLVMTDWWAKGNDEGEKGSPKNLSSMIRSQNDLYMVTPDAKQNTTGDDAAEGIAAGRATLGEYQRSAMNILRVLMKTPAFIRMAGYPSELDEQLAACITEEDAAFLNSEHIEVDGECVLDPGMLNTDKGCYNIFHVTVKTRGMYQLQLDCRSRLDNALAQIPVSVFIDKQLIRTITLTGVDNEVRREAIDFGPMYMNNFYLKLYFAQSGMEITGWKLKLIESHEEKIKAFIENH